MAARRLLWVSRPNTRHSRNVAERPEVSAVVFDSTVAVGAAQALYVCAWARELEGREREAGIAVFSARSVAHRAPARGAGLIQAAAPSGDNWDTMRRSLAVAAAAVSLAAAPTAVAAPAGTIFPVNGSYKGFTGAHLLSTARIAGKHLSTFTTNVQRFCSDGSTSYGRVVTTGLAGQPGSALKPAGQGGHRFAITLTTKTGAQAKVRATIRKGWMTGTVTYPDLAAIPMGPSIDAVPESAPSAGATCSTRQDATSNTMTFKLHFG